MHLHYAIILVSDMKRSLAFYRDTLGIPLRFESSHWTELATDGATIALHLAHNQNPDKPGASVEHAGHCRPGLQVPNLADFHKRMLEHNVTCLEQPKEVFGAKVAQYADPDGLAISISEARAG